MPLRRKKYLVQQSTIRIGTAEICYALCRSAARKTLSIAITPQAQVKISAPGFLGVGDIEKFILSKGQWVIRKLEQARQEQSLLAAKRYRDGYQLFFLGERHPIVFRGPDMAGPSLDFDGRSWTLTGVDGKEQNEIRELFVNWYKEQARELFPSRIFHHARLMGLDPDRIAVKEQKRSWGTCSFRHRAIHLNWQLIMAPVSVIDYVVIHELAHLRHPNHSRRFWSLVERHMPDYRQNKAWLKRHQAEITLP